MILFSNNFFLHKTCGFFFPRASLKCYFHYNYKTISRKRVCNCLIWPKLLYTSWVVYFRNCVLIKSWLFDCLRYKKMMYSYPLLLAVGVNGKKCILYHFFFFLHCYTYLYSNLVDIRKYAKIKPMIMLIFSEISILF